MSVGISVIIATYRSGDPLDRLIASLDAQTMSPDEFEIIFVDDGSPDDTVERLHRIAATHPNAQVLALEHSGWPSRPRNAGIDAARGEYVFFADHDDTFYPDALRRVYEFALEHNSDVVNPKESKGSDVWWGMDSFRDGNIANLHDSGGVGRLRELMPHKLYRRALLNDHNIRFPEGRRILWEDWYINVPAYRHGSVVSVLADTPVYRWHASEQNTTRTFDCAREEFWDRLEDLFEHITTTLAGEPFARDRVELLTYNVQVRVIHRFTRMLNRDEAPTQDSVVMAFDRARALLERYGTEDVLAQLSNKHLAIAHLYREGTTDHVLAFERADHSIRASAEVRNLRWDGGRLAFDTITTWRASEPDRAQFTERQGRVYLDAGPELSAVIAPELLDLTAELGLMRTELALRDRLEYVSWPIPCELEPATFRRGEHGSTVIVQHGHAVIDFATAACGQPIPDSVWDLRMRTHFYGIERGGPVGLLGRAAPAAEGRRAAIVYSNKQRKFSVDIGQNLRNLAIDSAPVVGQIGRIGDFSTELTALHATGVTRIPSLLAAVPVGSEPAEGNDASDAQAQLERCVTDHPFAAEVVVDDSGAWLTGHGELAAGDYLLYVRRREGLAPTRFGLTVNPAGGAQLIDLAG